MLGEIKAKTINLLNSSCFALISFQIVCEEREKNFLQKKNNFKKKKKKKFQKRRNLCLGD